MKCFFGCFLGTLLALVPTAIIFGGMTGAFLVEGVKRYADQKPASNDEAVCNEK